MFENRLFHILRHIAFFRYDTQRAEVDDTRYQRNDTEIEPVRILPVVPYRGDNECRTQNNSKNAAEFSDFIVVHIFS